MKFLKYALIVLFSVGMMSCGGGGGGDDADEQKPGITINSPSTATAETAGENLTVSAALTDNVELKSYVLTIKNTGTKATKTVNEDWTFDSRTTDQTMPAISGKSSTLSVTIEIPADVEPNDYKLELAVTDASNNSDTKSVTFEIK